MSLKFMTFPGGVNQQLKSIVGTRAMTAERNSGSSGTGSGAPATDTYQVERGVSYIVTTGHPMGGSGNGFKMRFDTKIAKHYWMTSIFGAEKHDNPSTHQYSPLYDANFKGITFKWKKVDNGSSSGQRFRIKKIGVVYRSGSTSTSLKDLPTDSSNLFKHASVGTTTGTSTLELSSGLSHPIGFYFQLETEGSGGAIGTSGSSIEIYDLKFIGTNTSREAILSPRAAYSSMSPPAKREIWTST